MPNSDYAKDVLVSTDWVESHLDEFQSNDPAYRFVEVDVDTEAYGESHVPDTIRLNWESQLQDQTTRDVLTRGDFEDLFGSHGVSEDFMVVLYGDNSNWLVIYTYWQSKYCGHENVHLTNGGRDYQVDNNYPITDETPSFLEQNYSARGPFEDVRAYRDDAEKAVDKGLPLVDVCSLEELSDGILAPLGLQGTARRDDCIPGMSNISWAATVNNDSIFKSADKLRDLYAGQGIKGDESTIARCRIGERSSIAWLAFHEPLGYENTTNYGGSWMEWGNLVGVPVEKGN